MKLENGLSILDCPGKHGTDAAARVDRAEAPRAAGNPALTNEAVLTNLPRFVALRDIGRGKDTRRAISHSVVSWQREYHES